MKPLLWDAINPFTGTPFTFDDPNLFWGDPSYYLEPGDPGFVPYPGMTTPKPKKPKKPFRHAPKDRAPNANEPTTRNTTMSTFKFTVIPKSSGGYRTQVALGEQIDESALTAQIATAAGVTPEQAVTVIKTLFQKLRDSAAASSWSRSLYGEINVRPTSGGSQTSTDAFQNAEEINADIALSYNADVIETWRSTLTLESQGIKGFVTPVIATTKSEENNATDHYVAGTMIRLIGENLRFDKADLTQGIFFIKADNSETRASVYGPINPSEVTVLVPAALTGTLRIRIAAFINGSVRSYTYTGSLT